ncbi:hypothetical protein Tco_1173640 [Tanacetum coccineum]
MAERSSQGKVISILDLAFITFTFPHLSDHIDSLDNESGLNHLQPLFLNAKEKSSDPFNLYDLLDKHKLNKQDKCKVNSTSDSSIPYPPGFTPENAYNFSDPQKVKDVECHMSQNRSNGFSSRIMEDAQPSNDNFHPLSPGAGHKSNKGGSILEVLDDMVKVGQSMGLFFVGWMYKRTCGAYYSDGKEIFSILNELLSIIYSKAKDIIGSDLLKQLSGSLFTALSLEDAILPLLPSYQNPITPNLSRMLTKRLFLPNRQILDGPFIINDLLSWCKSKKQQAMVFKVDFAKAYDFIRWDYLDEVLRAFGFGFKWRSWIGGSPTFGLDSFILVNGARLQNFNSTAVEARVVDEGIFTGVPVDRVAGLQLQKIRGVRFKTLLLEETVTLLKAVLGSTPIYNMSIYKVPKSVLHTMESLRRNFFNGVQADERNITWIKWPKVLVSKKYGGLLVFQVSTLLIGRFCLNGFGDLFRLKSLYGVGSLKLCMFWNDVWVCDSQLQHLFPRLFALETNKDCSVASKIQSSVISTFRRPVRGGIETAQLDLLEKSIEGTILSTLDDRFQTRGVRFAFQPRKIRLIYFLAAVWPGMLPGWCVVGGMFRGLLFPRMQTGLCGFGSQEPDAVFDATPSSRCFVR